jgi:fumarate reductase subunit D
MLHLWNSMFAPLLIILLPILKSVNLGADENHTKYVSAFSGPLVGREMCTIKTWILSVFTLLHNRWDSLAIRKNCVPIPYS